MTPLAALSCESDPVFCVHIWEFSLVSTDYCVMQGNEHRNSVSVPV